MTRLQAGSATDVGRVRSNNQDSMLVAGPLFAVADGMGGHAAGEVASATALDGLRRAFEAGDPPSPGLLGQAVQAANQAVWDAAEANADYRGMGTTLTALALVVDGGDEQVAVANVGDSRTYRLRGGELEQITADHSLVAELVVEGQITEEEAETHPQRHVLTRALGIQPDVAVDLQTVEAVAGDRFLLCSDGLIREVADARVASVLRRLDDPVEAARELVAEARANGGSDNITVVVVDVVGEGATDGDGTGDPTAAVPVPDAVAGQASAPSGGAPSGSAPSGGDDQLEDATVPSERAALLAGAAEPGPEVAPLSRRERRAQRRREAAATPRPPRARLVTVRVVGFVFLLLVVVAVAVGGTAWYARDSYFVTVRGTQLVIYKGRPGGVLWWKPTVAVAAAAPTSTVEAYHLPALRSGVQEANLTAARAYVGRLQAELRQDTASSPTTVPSTTPTTVPTSAAPSTTAKGG